MPQNNMFAFASVIDTEKINKIQLDKIKSKPLLI